LFFFYVNGSGQVEAGMHGGGLVVHIETVYAKGSGFNLVCCQ